jgi:hypothetical protein
MIASAGIAPDQFVPVERVTDTASVPVDVTVPI